MMEAPWERREGREEKRAEDRGKRGRTERGENGGDGSAVEGGFVRDMRREGEGREEENGRKQKKVE